MNTYAMYLFEFFIFNNLRCLIISCDNSVFALVIGCMECRLKWGGGSHLKQFNIRQQHNNT